MTCFFGALQTAARAESSDEVLRAPQADAERYRRAVSVSRGQRASTSVRSAGRAARCWTAASVSSLQPENST